MKLFLKLKKGKERERERFLSLFICTDKKIVNAYKLRFTSLANFLFGEF